VLVDSDVLVWLTRGHTGAAMRLKKVGAWRISAITYMELAQGCRDTPELERVKKALGANSATIAPVTESICERAMLLIDRHALGDGLRLADALIAATALEHGLPLLTANVKHFAPIMDLTVEWFDRSDEATS
jgi:predicted nucleic acid-binding protein